MLIVHVAHNSLTGGVSSVVRNLIAEQEKSGFHTALVTYDGYASAARTWVDANGYSTKVYPIERFRAKHPTIWGEISGKTMRKIRRDFPDETIVYHMHNPLSIGLFCRVKAPMVMSIHILLHGSNKLYNRLFLHLLRRTMRMGGVLVAVSEYCARDFSKKLGGKAVRTVLNGVVDLPRAENRCVADNGRVHIGFASYMDDLKGWEFLADAFTRLPPSTRAKADLYFAGPVDPADEQTLQNYLAQNDDIHHMDYIYDARVAFIPYLDILALPSRSESQGMVLLEAFQAGVPVCATSVGGIPEVLEDGKNGLFITRDGADIAQKLQVLIENPQLREEMGRNGRSFYENHGTSQHMAEGYRKIYEEITAR